MKKVNSEKNFNKLEFEDRVFIIEELLPDEFYSGQVKIGYLLPKDLDPESNADLPPTPPDIEKVENEKFELLISELTEYLFIKYGTLDLDIEKMRDFVDKSNEKFLNNDFML